MSTNNTRYGLLIDYEFCTNCHSCEVACKKELNLPAGQFGIKVLEDGPRQLPTGKYEWRYVPVPTELCDLCEGRVTAGKQPTCVHHCQAKVMSYGPVEELAKKASEKTKMVLFTVK